MARFYTRIPMGPPRDWHELRTLGQALRRFRWPGYTMAFVGGFLVDALIRLLP